MSSKLRVTIQDKVKKYHQAIKMATMENVGVRFAREMKKWLCRNDLFYLLAITGHNRIAEMREVYQPFCDMVSLQTWKVVELGMYPASEGMVACKDIGEELDMQRMFLCYRSFYKTTIVTIGHSCQLLLNFPNIHIVLCHNKQNTSSLNLVAIKNLFTSRPELSPGNMAMLKEEYGVTAPLTLQTLFPECVPETKEWGSGEKFSLANRTDWQRPEANVQAVGVDTEITGGHWDVAKKNDLVTEKAVNTEEQIGKTDDWDARFMNGHFTNITMPLQDYEGTRYHYNDLYSKKLKEAGIRKVLIPVLKDLKLFLDGDDGQITHPSRYKREDIMAMYDYDRWVFMCQQMLQPDDPAKKRFTDDMINYYDGMPDNVNCYLLVDPAGERKKKSDYTSMTVVGVNTSGKKMIVDLVRDKIGPDERVDLAVDLIKRYKIRDIGWEKIGLSNDTFYLNKRFKEDKINCVIHEIISHTQSKNDRIRDILVPQYARGEWLWPKERVHFSKFHVKNIDMVEELKNEFLQFPHGSHDDMLDTQTFLSQISVIHPEEKKAVENKELTLGKYIKIKEDRIKAGKRDPWGGMNLAGRI